MYTEMKEFIFEFLIYTKQKHYQYFNQIFFSFESYEMSSFIYLVWFLSIWAEVLCIANQ